MNNRVREWIKQADYDIETAEFMYQGGRYFYSVFMCHLAIEKALKGLYQKRLQEVPPKTHNLIYLLNKVGLKPDKDRGRIITRLGEASIATRYPEDIERLRGDYTSDVTSQILSQAKGVLEWIKQQY